MACAFSGLYPNLSISTIGLCRGVPSQCQGAPAIREQMTSTRRGLWPMLRPPRVTHCATLTGITPVSTFVVFPAAECFSADDVDAQFATA